MRGRTHSQSELKKSMKLKFVAKIAKLGCLGVLSVAGVANAQYAVFNTSVPTYPGGGYGIPITTGGELFATGGDVTVTYLGWHGAGDDEYLFLATPGDAPYSLTGSPGDTSLYSRYSYGGNGGNVQQLIDNQVTPAGYTVDLGSFAAGTEVEFGIFNWDGNNGGTTWLDGPGSRNANGDGLGNDGAVHAYIINNFSYDIVFPNNNIDDPIGTYVGFEDLNNATGADDNYADLQFIFNGVQGVGQSAPDASATFSLLGLGLGGLAAMGRRFKK